jgi:glycosyltransferase involved in cell wall biosynthesis
MVKNKRNFNLIVLANTISPNGTMGGNTKIFLEFARRWSALGVPISVITYEEGLKTCQAYKLNNVNYVVVPSSKFSKYGLLVFYTVQILRSCVIALKIRGDFVVYSASDFFPDVIPALLMKKKNAHIKWIGSNYLPTPNPFKGFDFAYEKRLRFLPNIRLLASYLMEKVTNVFLTRYAGAIFVTNELDKEFYVDKGFSLSKLRAIYGGVDLAEIKRMPAQPQLYDGCFVGRIHPQKGVLYLVDIWEKVCTVIPNAKLALIGNGPNWYEQRVRNRIYQKHLEKNIDLLGFVDGPEKYRILKSSKVFLHTSVYDNCGMAAAEGMACGLPVVRFNIPYLKVAFPKGTLAVPLKDCESFAKCVLDLLSDSQLYKKVRQDALDSAIDWDWNKKAQETLGWLREILFEQDQNGKFN